ncbi:ABC transporter permease subunit [Microbacterium sp. No. 7]|uniref:ABC transporter permease subunit n=1 Tax=Microbacterium sp. No. 7 TaxID=1714373 RepID=UPI0006D15177|nr:ATP-binding cassette domain-containing protein [Microbacterium sp. No. 7]ALJ19267.1 hypothetical protein AOA12_04855 [Microbacterium sp. No. 7]
MLTVILSGIVTGLLYALAGQSLVVIYRTTKVLNFAIAGQGVIVAYLAYEMLGAGLPYWLVFPTVILAGAVLGAIVERLVVFPLRRQPVLTIAVATLGVLLILEGLAGWIWGPTPKSLPRILGELSPITLGDFVVAPNQIFVIVVAVIATVLLLWLIEKTKLGLGMRATSSGPLTASILGVNVSNMRLNSWIIGGAYAALAALLVTPIRFLSPTEFVTFILSAIAAVVIGGFTNIVGVAIGAVLFGVGSALMVMYLDSGIIATFTFVVIALVLLFRPHGLFGKPEKHVSEPEIINRKPQSLLTKLLPGGGRPRAHAPALKPRAKRTVALVGWIVALALFVLVPFTQGAATIFLVGMILATYIAVVGVNVVTGYTGEVSLATSGLALLGGYAMAIALKAGWSLPLALLIAVVAAVVAGIVIGLIATRVAGIYLVVLTLLFAFVVPELVNVFKDITGGFSGLAARSDMAPTTISQYWLILVLAIVVTALTLWLTGNRIGRNWRAVRDSANGARALGLNPSTVKLGAFVYGAALAGLSGALIILMSAFVGPESFSIFWAIYMLLAVVLGGTGSIGGSLIGAVFVVWVPRNVGDLPIPLIFGIALILVLLVAPGGVAGLYEKLVRRVAARFGRGSAVVSAEPLELADAGEAELHLATDAEVPGAGATGVLRVPSKKDAKRAAAAATRPVQPAASPAPVAPDALLSLNGLSTGYGAGLVLRGLTLHVNAGEMVTLLGANGGGKSTALRAISGLLPVLDGSITWQGQQIGSRGLHTAAAIARTRLSHVPEGRGIFPDLSVLENLKLGRFADSSQSNAEFETRLERVFGYFPILKERLKQDGGTLSGGEQQMLAIGRALMGGPKLLMLDEPSLGLSPLYSQQVLDNLRRIVDDGETAVLLIEQNARAALERTDRAYVLSRGTVKLEGTAHELLTEHDLSELYLAVEA